MIDFNANSDGGLGDAPKKKNVPTRDEKRARMAYVRELMSAGHTDTQCRALAADKFGGSTRSYERYILAVRNEAVKETGLTKEQLRAQAYLVYHAVMLNPKSEPADIIRAQTRLDKLFGLEAPIKVAETDPDGKHVSAEREANSLDTILGIVSKRAGLAADQTGSN